MLVIGPNMRRTLDGRPWPATLDVEGLVRSLLQEQSKAADKAVHGAILDGYRAGRVPRYVWHHPQGALVHSGQEPPQGGPWVVYQVTPFAVAYALGRRTPL